MHKLSVIKDCFEIAFYFVSSLAVFFSAWTYRRNSSRERSQWIYELYKRFWDDETLQQIRLHLDWGGTSCLNVNDPMNPALDNYLNFFEFIAFRWMKKELPAKEIDSMFGYFLEQIGTRSDFRAYLERYGYEQLSALLLKLGYSEKYYARD